jgi:riboflavin kinase / FMN adenylyltransferase
MKAKGIVVPNKRNGTKFGYPTANIAFGDRTLDGIFVGYTKVLSTEDSRVTNAFAAGSLPSIIFIGTPETVNENEHRLESHILDFPLIDLYGSEIEVEIRDKLRDNQRFDNVEELIERMKNDEALTREWFSLND